MSLEKALAASKPIHCRPESSTVPAWTLRQLVPAHEGICRSMFMMATNETLVDVKPTEIQSSAATIEEVTTDFSKLSLEDLIDQRWRTLFHLSDQDRVLCQEVLQSGTDEKKLLVLQYFQFLLRQQQQNDSGAGNGVNNSHAGLLQGLELIVIPFLLGTSSSQQISHELRLALLDAVFDTTSGDKYHPESILSSSSSPSSTTSRVTDSHHIILQRCLDQCRSVTPPTQSDDEYDDQFHAHQEQSNAGVHVSPVSRWISACQILIRLYHEYNGSVAKHDTCEETATNGAELVMQAIMYKILESLEGSVVADDTRLSPLLRPVTEDFLPLLLQQFAALESAVHPGNTDQQPQLCSTKTSTQLDKIWIKLQSMMCAVISGNDAKSKAEELNGNHAPFKNGTLDHRQRRILLVVTTVLCSILPALVQYEMPNSVSANEVTTPYNDDNRAPSGDQSQQLPSERSLPLYQPCVWQLILICLQQQQQQQGQRQKRTAGNTSRAHIANDTLLRRRGIFLLRTLVEATIASNETTSAAHTPDKASFALMASTWSKYVACVETLEMESEVHLVDQVWPVVRDLCAQANRQPEQEKDNGDDASLVPPALDWSWIRLLLTRALQPDDTTPVMRKLCLYRFLHGQAGIRMTPRAPTTDDDNSATSKQKQRKKKKGRDPTNHAGGGKVAAAPLEMISTDFVLGVVVPSFDILHQSVGTTINIEENGKVQGQNMVPMLESFLRNYLLACCTDGVKLYSFIFMLFGGSVVGQLRSRALVIVYNSIAAALRQENNAVIIPTDDKMLQTLVDSFYLLLQNTSVVVKHREELLRAIATILSNSAVMEGSRTNPKLLLQVLAMFPLSIPPRMIVSGDGSMVEPNEPLWSDPTYLALQTWLLDCQGKNNGNVSWASSVGTACAAAFVDGTLLPSGKWDPTTGASQLERQTGLAIGLLCTLSSGSNRTTDQDITASQMLWPAINKGLSVATKIVALAKQTQSKPEDSAAGRVTRALILLGHGCQFRVLSGMGNGDLVVDRGTQQMMPPPPSIEDMLQGAVSFLLYSVQSLVAYDPDREQVRGGSLTSTEASRVSSTFATLIHQLQRLHEAYPSSVAVSSSVQSILEESMSGLTTDQTKPEAMLRHAALSYALLSCGAGLESSLLSVDVCRQLLHLKWTEHGRQERIISLDEQTARSVFHLSRWGSLSCLLPVVLEMLRKEANQMKSKGFLTELLDIASDSVEATPPHSLVPLFQCVRLAGHHYLALDFSDDDEIVYVDYMEKIIGALFSFLEDSGGSRDAMYMLNEICALIFQPELLRDESNRLRRNNEGKAPIRDAFRRLLTMAGSQRPHISRTSLSWMTVAWLGPDNVEQGMSAIWYREDILKLLVHKEAIIDELSANQSVGRAEGSNNSVMQVPSPTDELSVTRSFVLVFLSKLPPIEAMSPGVATELVHFLLEGVLETVSTCIPKGKMVMKGSSEYSLQMRGWQALCILSRFVNGDVVRSVCEKSFNCLTDCLHGQIRYFMENFTIQIARKHPDIVGDKLLERLRRRDLTLQEVSSILIIAGNLVVGRYKADFIQVVEPDMREQRLREVLAYSIPWLSSTQGFSRAIAQLLVHQLIEQVIDVKVDMPLSGSIDSDSILRSIYMFLEQNAEMSRLRKKQMKFFERYDADAVCSPDFILKIPIDEGNEANPLHLVEAIKSCLQEIYDDSHSQSTPSWRQMEALLEAQDNEQSSGQSDLVNFQRKIIPIDALNLLLEDTRERRLRNSVGRRKQQLIVCASLVDKVPNLGGLARTAEIFAADRLVVPDINMTQMDNFKTLCVGADEWIQMEECREENLLAWLRDYRNRGYFVVGLEQTSSSVSLEALTFPDQPTILLLGKEKEGIPVEFLQAVDLCVEIPQLGIIRSLNVHVSGAIAIWERTKQLMLKDK